VKILLVPSVKEIYKNQIEFCVDQKLILFLKKAFPKSKIEIFNNNILKNFDLVVFSGGNSTNTKNKKDKIRKKISNCIYKFSQKNKIKIYGICYGAQFIAEKFKFNLKKSNSHVGNHNVYIEQSGLRKEIKVNSYHDEIIMFKKSKNINIFATSMDNTVEAFHIKKNKILCIIWHPERYKNFKKIDIDLIRNFYATNSIIRR
jgi:gamma-glutamyl-gamma-aminobutyrate hydrolase PuuD